MSTNGDQVIIVGRRSSSEKDMTDSNNDTNPSTISTSQNIIINESEGNDVQIPSTLNVGISLDDNETGMNTEARVLFQTYQNTIPFILLFLLYIFYLHYKGFAIFLIGTAFISSLDKRLKIQIALKDDAKIFFLLILISFIIMGLLLISILNNKTTYINVSTYNIFLSINLNEEKKIKLNEILWLILINDFSIRLISLLVKILILSIKFNIIHLFINLSNINNKNSNKNKNEVKDALITSMNITKERSPMNENATLQNNKNNEIDFNVISTDTQKIKKKIASIYRRKKKIYSLIEYASLFLRVLLPIIPWTQYYREIGSPIISNFFTGVYLLLKIVVASKYFKKCCLLFYSAFRITNAIDYGRQLSESDIQESGSSTDCPICYESLDNPIQLMECRHVFCLECVSEWLDKERSCPVCRSHICHNSNGTFDAGQYADGRTALLPQFF